MQESKAGVKKFTSSLSLYIIVVGWIGTLVYIAILTEHEGIQYVIGNFISYEQNALRFRALVFFLPLMATVVGFLMYEKEKYFHALIEKKQEVDRANKQLEEMIKQKDLFLVRLGHDLKTPLTPLVTLLPLIKDREEGTKQRELLEVAVHNVNTLKDLVVKSLKLARVKSSKELKLEKIHLKNEVDGLVSKRKDYLDGRDIRISNKIGETVTVFADKDEVEELIHNLISNAIKYSPSNAEILIEGEQNEKYAHISVTDFGVGLSQNQLKHIFDEFYKVDESRHELDSSGLGLSICKNIVWNHGGKIHAKSDGLGKGTTIRFTLPCV